MPTTAQVTAFLQKLLGFKAGEPQVAVLARAIISPNNRIVAQATEEGLVDAAGEPIGGGGGGGFAVTNVASNAAKLALAVPTGTYVRITGENNRIELLVGADPSSPGDWIIFSNRALAVADTTARDALGALDGYPPGLRVTITDQGGHEETLTEAGEWEVTKDFILLTVVNSSGFPADFNGVEAPDNATTLVGWVPKSGFLVTANSIIKAIWTTPDNAFFAPYPDGSSTLNWLLGSGAPTVFALPVNVRPLAGVTWSCLHPLPNPMTHSITNPRLLINSFPGTVEFQLNPDPSTSQQAAEIQLASPGKPAIAIGFPAGQSIDLFQLALAFQNLGYAISFGENGSVVVEATGQASGSLVAIITDPVAEVWTDETTIIVGEAGKAFRPVSLFAQVTAPWNDGAGFEVGYKSAVNGVTQFLPVALFLPSESGVLEPLALEAYAPNIAGAFPGADFVARSRRVTTGLDGDAATVTLHVVGLMA